MTDVTTTDSIGSKITQALKAGSGVDIHDLATTLADAETMPQINAITAKKEASTVSLSGLGVLKASVSSLKTSYEALTDHDTLLSKSVKIDDDNKAEVEMMSQTSAKAGTTAIVVNQMAQSQQNRVQDNGSSFTSLSQSLTGSNFTITIKVPRDAGSGTDVVVSTHTPQGIIDAVNSITTTTGVTARAFNMASSGTDFSILLEGKTGAAKSFDFTSTLSGGDALSGGAWANRTSSAQDLQLTVNSMANVYRETNSPTDIIPGVQTTFKKSSGDTINITVSEDTKGLETSVNALIESFNSVVTISDYLIGESDEEDELAGSLSSEKNTVNLVLGQIRDLVGKASSTASNGFSTLRNLGITTQLSGKLKLNSTTYAAAVKANFSDIRTMLTADTNNQVGSDPAVKGLALDSINILDAIVNNTGTLTTKETSVTEDVTRYEDDLVEMQERLESIKARYLQQFAAMETLVQRSKNTGEYLTHQFKAMESVYKS